MEFARHALPEATELRGGRTNVSSALSDATRTRRRASSASHAQSEGLVTPWA